MVQIWNKLKLTWPETLGSRGHLLEQSRRGSWHDREAGEPHPHPGWPSQREAKSGICSQLRTHFWTKISQKWGLSLVLITGLALLSRDSGRHACSASNLPTITARPGHTFSITCLVTHACHLSDPSCPPHNPGIRLDGHIPFPVTIRSISKSGWICPWNTVYPDQPLIWVCFPSYPSPPSSQAS